MWWMSEDSRGLHVSARVEPGAAGLFNVTSMTATSFGFGPAPERRNTMKAIFDYVAKHRKWITAAILTAASTYAASAAGTDSAWYTVIIPAAAAALGVSLVPNRRAGG